MGSVSTAGAPIGAAPPLGVAQGFDWRPPAQRHEKAPQAVVATVVELAEAMPWIRDIAAAIADVRHFLFHRSGLAPGESVERDDPGSWTFGAVGDWGAAARHQEAVVRLLNARALPVLLSLGDTVYPSGREQDYRRAFDPPRYMSSVASRTLFLPVLGNHDYERHDLRPFFARFPGLRGRPYSTMTVRDVQFFLLDSEQDLRPGSPQHSWLQRELERSNTRWRVVAIHRPTRGSDASDSLRRDLEPLLARAGVHLVLAGHLHAYERTHAIDGVVHVISGGGGQQVFNFRKDAGPDIAYRVKAYHHVEVTVSAARLVVRAVATDGHVLDTGVIPWRPRAGVRGAARGARILDRGASG